MDLRAMWRRLRGGPRNQTNVVETFGTMDHEPMRRAFGQASVSGKMVDDESINGVSAVWACRRILSESVASIPWALFKKDASGNVQPGDDHQLHEVLVHNPNADQTPVEFIEMLIYGLTGQGNAYSYVERLGKGVSALTPIEGSVKPLRAGNGVTSTEKTIAPGQVFFRLSDRGRPVDLPREKVWQVKGWGGRSRLEGLSPIGVQREAAGGALAAEEFANRFFSQGGLPSGIISIPQWLNTGQRQIARENLSQMVTGLGNAHRFALFEGGMKPEAWEGMNLQDMQFVLVREFSVLEICRFHRVPPHMVAKIDKGASYASAEQFSQDFIMFTLLPYFRRIESSVQKWLLSPADRAKGYYLRFNYEGFLRAASGERATFYAQALQNGWMNRNEVRAKENMNKVAGLDAYTCQTNLAPADKVGSGEAMKQQQKGFGGRPGDEPDERPIKQ